MMSSSTSVAIIFDNIAIPEPQVPAFKKPPLLTGGG